MAEKPPFFNLESTDSEQKSKDPSPSDTGSNFVPNTDDDIQVTAVHNPNAETSQANPVQEQHDIDEADPKHDKNNVIELSDVNEEELKELAPPNSSSPSVIAPTSSNVSPTANINVIDIDPKRLPEIVSAENITNLEPEVEDDNIQSLQIITHMNYLQKLKDPKFAELTTDNLLETAINGHHMTFKTDNSDWHDMFPVDGSAADTEKKNKANVRCTGCGDVWKKGSMFHHWERKHAARTSAYECDICYIQTKLYIDMSNHMKKTHPDRRQSVNVNDLNIKVPPYVDIRICELCQIYTTVTKEAMYFHHYTCHIESIKTRLEFADSADELRKAREMLELAEQNFLKPVYETLEQRKSHKFSFKSDKKSATKQSGVTKSSTLKATSSKGKSRKHRSPAPVSPCTTVQSEATQDSDDSDDTAFSKPIPIIKRRHRSDERTPAKSPRGASDKERPTSLATSRRSSRSRADSKLQIQVDKLCHRPTKSVLTTAAATFATTTVIAPMLSPSASRHISTTPKQTTTFSTPKSPKVPKVQRHVSPLQCDVSDDISECEVVEVKPLTSTGFPRIQAGAFAIPESDWLGTFEIDQRIQPGFCYALIKLGPPGTFQPPHQPILTFKSPEMSFK